MTRFWLMLAVTATLVSRAGAGDAPPRRGWKIGDVTREALVYVPPSAKDQAAPVVFVFHGHGGTIQAMAQKWGVQRLWPEAICVYMQGLPTPGKLTDPEGKRPGWQFEAGTQGDRDLKFFDAVLASLRQEYKVDDRRIYVTGHSNGGSLTFLLWATRGDVFAAVAPSGSAATKLAKDFKPLPCLHVAGEKDPLVKIEWQRATVDAVRKLNGCAGEERDGKLLVYPSSTQTPLVTYIYPGGHTPPADTAEVVVAFFKKHARP